MIDGRNPQLFFAHESMMKYIFNNAFKEDTFLFTENITNKFWRYFLSSLT